MSIVANKKDVGALEDFNLHAKLLVLITCPYDGVKRSTSGEFLLCGASRYPPIRMKEGDRLSWFAFFC